MLDVCACEYQSRVGWVEVIIWKIMEWSIQVATGCQRAIKWQGVELDIAIKSLLDLYILPHLTGQLDMFSVIRKVALTKSSPFI